MSTETQSPASTWDWLRRRLITVLAGSTVVCSAVAATLLFFGCPGYINTPSTSTPTTGPVISTTPLDCPTGIPDQDPSICPRLKNIMLTCGGNGKLTVTVSGGSGNPFVLGAQLANGSNLSAVVVTQANLCQDGPREGITFGVTYTGQVFQPPTSPPCIVRSKALYTQFQFGDPLYAGLEGMAKDKIWQTLDDQAIANFASYLGLPAPAASRCSNWQAMP